MVQRLRQLDSFMQAHAKERKVTGADNATEMGAAAKLLHESLVAAGICSEIDTMHSTKDDGEDLDAVGHDSEDEDIDGEPMDDDDNLDGEPMDDDQDLDGEPMD